jgi:basic membrane protein A and related proteins
VNKTFQFATLLGAVALVAAACGEAPGEGDGAAATGGETTAAQADFQTCMVSDEGGVNDRSFNEKSYKGLQDAFEAGATLEPKFAESQAEADYAPNVQAMVDDECGLIVTVGFKLAATTQEAATANPEEQFTIVDYKYSEAVDGVAEIPNVKPLVFNTHEAAYLAGYLAAGMTETGKVGTWGGAKINTVTIFMDGFADGVAAYNEAKGTNVEVLGWDKEAQEGQFTNDFANTGLALQFSQNLIDQGADILLPVAGPIGESAAVAAQDAGNVKVIWVDADGYETLPDYKALLLTSVLKGLDTAVETAATEAAEDNFSNEPFIGTLENDGVGLAPYHDFDSAVPQELKDEVEQLKEQIISGELVVESQAAFS